MLPEHSLYMHVSNNIITIALAPGCYPIIKRPKPPKLSTSATATATASSFHFHLITISLLFLEIILSEFKRGDETAKYT